MFSESEDESAGLLICLGPSERLNRVCHIILELSGGNFSCRQACPCSLRKASGNAIAQDKKHASSTPSGQFKALQRGCPGLHAMFLPMGVDSPGTGFIRSKIERESREI